MSMFDPAGYTFAGSVSERLDGGALWWLLFVFGAVTVLFFLGGYLGFRGKLRPNPYFGIRNTHTQGDEEAWYAVHRKAAPWMIVSAAAMLVGTVATYLVQDPTQQMVWGLGALAVSASLIVAGGLVSSWSVRDEALRQESAEGGKRSPAAGERDG